MYMKIDEERLQAELTKRIDVLESPFLAYKSEDKEAKEFFDKYSDLYQKIKDTFAYSVFLQLIYETNYCEHEKNKIFTLVDMATYSKYANVSMAQIIDAFNYLSNIGCLSHENDLFILEIRS